MSNPAMNQSKQKTGIAAAAAKRAAMVAAAPPAKEVEDALDGFDDDKEPEKSAAPLIPLEEQEPEVKTRKQADLEVKEVAKKIKKVEGITVKLMDDFVRSKKGEIRKDEDGDEMRYAAGFHKGVGFVNANGVRFPVGYKFKGGLVGTFGNVILNRCPKCFHSQSVDSARSGKCDNMRAGPEKQICGYDQVREMEEFTTKEID